MSWDIYGEPLRRGHCEVHPHVHEEYPCSVCIADKRSSDQQGGCMGNCESEHLLSLQREHIEHLEQERDALAAHLESLIQEIEGALRIKDLWLPSHCEPEHEGECQALGMMHSAFLRVVVETPETSLARLKARWQAEAVSTFAFHHLGGHEQEVAEMYASKLRQHLQETTMSTDTEEAPFTFACIDYDFDEAQYMRAADLISNAATLFGDGRGNELGENEEYERGAAELICMSCGIPQDLKDQVINEIHEVARQAEGGGV